jgi:hypothetical protein
VLKSYTLYGTEEVSNELNLLFIILTDNNWQVIKKEDNDKIVIIRPVSMEGVMNIKYHATSSNL